VLYITIIYITSYLYINLQEGGINEEIIEVTELHQMRPQTRMGPISWSRRGSSKFT